MAVNLGNVIRLLVFPLASPSAVSERERDLARHVSGIIKTYMRSSVDVEDDYELVFENASDAEMDSERASEETANVCVGELEAESEEACASSSSRHGTPVPVKRNKTADIPFDKRKAAVAFWTGANKKRRLVSSVQNRFRFVESKSQLESWLSQVQQNGPYHEKMCNVASCVRAQFIQARIEKKTVHDQDLRRWGLLEARRQNVNFKASMVWLHAFKSANRITSRKITKFVSRGAAERTDEIVENAKTFVSTIRDDLKDYSLDDVYNTDQSGFNLEMHSGRTLATVGEKHVDSTAQSVSATTHSYTIMPTVTASGKLLSPMAIVFKETDGKFGPIVEHGLFRESNILPIAAKSSIMGKKEIAKWFEEAFLPNTSEKSLLLVDSLKAYNSAKEALPRAEGVKIRTIPPLTTGLIQPCDVFLFRQWKNFVRKISELVLLEDLDFHLRNRNNISRIQSLTHNQFGAPKFLNFRLHAWYKAGYLDGEAPRFVNPIDHCFKSEEMWCSKCANVKLLKCGWCDLSLCFHHVFGEWHFHKDV